MSNPFTLPFWQPSIPTSHVTVELKMLDDSLKEELTKWDDIQNTVVDHLMEPGICPVSVVDFPRRRGKSYVLMKFIRQKEKQLEEAKGPKFRMLIAAQGSRVVDGLKQFLSENLGELQYVDLVIVAGGDGKPLSRQGQFDCLWIDEWDFCHARRQIKLVSEHTTQIVCIGTPDLERSDEAMMFRLNRVIEVKKEGVQKIDCTGGVVKQSMIRST